ncbi:MAG: GUN4 domain-containing protein [Elainellaceae cyanobacterium]
MTHPSPNPQPDDAVLGGESIPRTGIILGGLDGVERRLASPVVEHRCEALTEAIEYGQGGLSLVIQALRDPSEHVRQAAYRLLQRRPETRAQNAVKQFYIRTHYGQLQRALATGRWEIADRETRTALLQASGKVSNALPQPHPDWLLKCSCYDLRLIDYLWRHYSGGRFGFSVQQRIWTHCFNTYWDKVVMWSSFGDTVGWRSLNLLLEKRWKRYPELTFSRQAPTGHLPFMGDEFGIFTVEAIAQRLDLCDMEDSIHNADT